jgi:hypothetical protein
MTAVGVGGRPAAQGNAKHDEQQVLDGHQPRELPSSHPGGLQGAKVGGPLGQVGGHGSEQQRHGPWTISGGLLIGRWRILAIVLGTL